MRETQTDLTHAFPHSCAVYTAGPSEDTKMGEVSASCSPHVFRPFVVATVPGALLLGVRPQRKQRTACKLQGSLSLSHIFPAAALTFW